jgi:hypothetical protein
VPGAAEATLPIDCWKIQPFKKQPFYSPHRGWWIQGGERRNTYIEMDGACSCNVKVYKKT